MPSLGGWELLLILAVLVLLFGAKKLPDSARAIGRSLRIFKAETKGLREDEKNAEQSTLSAQSDQAAQPQQLPPASPQAAPQTGAKVTEPAETQARNDSKH